MLVISPMESPEEGDAEYMMTIAPTGGKAGFGSVKLFFTLQELIESLRRVRFTAKALDTIETDMKARVTHIAPGVQLSLGDFETLGIQPPG